MRKTFWDTSFDRSKIQLIGRANNLGHGVASTSADNYWEAGLYRIQKSGVYFLAGRGGHKTDFAASMDTYNRAYLGGVVILLVARDEALYWADEYLSEKK